VSRALYTLPLPLAIAVIGLWRRGRVVSLFTILVIATAVAMVVSVEMASRSVDRELARTARSLAGEADLEVTGGRMRVPEHLVEQLRQLPGVRAAAPLLYAMLRVASGDRAGDPLHLVGVDLAGDLSVHGLSVEDHRVEVRDPARLLAVPGAVVVTGELLDRLNVEPGGRIPVRGPMGPAELSVQGVLSGPIAEAYAGLLLATDLYSMQELIGARGWVDRISLVLEPEADRADVERRIAALVSGIATLRPAGAQSAWAFQAVSIMQTALLVFIGVGIGLAGLLGYAAISRAAESQIAEFAIMCSAGVEGRSVFAAIVLEAALLGAAGTLLGLPAGIWLSPLALRGASSPLAVFERLELRDAEVSAQTWLLGVSTGMVACLAGSLLPARRATRRAPLDVLRAARPTDLEREGELPWLPWLLATAPLAAASPALFAPLPRLALVLVSFVALLGLGLRSSLRPAMIRARPLLEGLLARIGSLVGAAFVARSGQASIAITTIAAVLAAVGALSIVLNSISQSTIEFVMVRYRDGILVTPGAPEGFRPGELLRPETIEIIRDTPGVLAVSEQQVSEIILEDRGIALYASDAAAVSRFARYPTVGGDSREVARALVAGSVAVTEAFQRTFALGPGDIVTLDTPRGRRAFPIAGVVRDFGPRAGGILVDIHTFDRLWPRNGATSLTLFAEEPRARVVERILERTGSQEPFHLVYGSALEQMVQRGVGSMTELLWAVGLVITGFGGVGVLNVLLGSIAARERELALVQAAGFTRGQVVGVVLADAVIVGALGSGLGVLSALILGYPFCWAVGETLGWTFALAVPWGQLALLAAGTLAMAAAAGLYPALVAQRAAVPEALAFD
jgi:putative ABC transport system permease protein